MRDHNATDEKKKESATPLGVTLSKVTATDVYFICAAANIDPSLLIKR